ncbi:hypothetical protein EOA27_32275 [Mesorhizobium sp. M2A.F.Ca.ET.037.01.1.1]|uniref:hypothetical protein n=1 Tax=Mesorhizobium sp. M2A.F.Ca.ET.037.01.1.1 TaxID=2496748 RepID=UPI000FCBFFC2|nr:hypothetical protein [Mesorhizobium sp. M2A.F.Ca.ET.037.01.1.1]RUX02344.1 hypothetical protein EOA27_32275 [Mesorhizobium sp. M2A.F.Ca.ET.037.01.1.1]
MKHAREDYNRIQDPAGLIPDGEPVFLIRAQDACATWTLAHWIMRARHIKADASIIQAAADHLDRMYAWQEVHGVKVPDLAGASVGVSSRALADIAAERRRQVEVEGFDAAHDDAEHDAGEFAGAASAYALNAACVLHPFQGTPLDEPPESWLFEPSWWKPRTPREDLVRAGALILAEIEKIDREVTKP